MSFPPLSLLETRILGVLVEKQHTVPDTYPLTLNALVAGCNQKTSRDPILNATDADVLAAIDRLRAFSLIVESSGGRVMRYSHNVERVLAVPAQAVALLTALMLRGPQTVGELRINCDRLHRFADSSAVEGFLNELGVRSTGPLVVELTRQPGARDALGASVMRPAGGRDRPSDRRPRRHRCGRRPRDAEGRYRAVAGRARSGESHRAEVVRGPWHAPAVIG